METAMTEKAPESLVKEEKPKLDLTRFDEQEISKINDIAKSIDLQDSQSVVSFGVGAQRDISKFADSVLEQVKAKDAGHVGELMSNLILQVKELDVDNLPAKKSMLSKLPFIGGLWNSYQKFIVRYDKLSVQIEKIIKELDQSRMMLLKDITMMDDMYQSNMEYLKNLDIYIAAGEQKLEELEMQMLPELKKKAEESGDPLDAQHYQDFCQLLHRFDKKVHDLKLSRTISIQTGPQLRLIQSNNQTLVEKIQSSVLNTIPLWKNQLVIAISLFRQNKALQQQRQVANTTNDLLQKNAELLKNQSIDVARESERGIVDMETLKKVNKDLVTTLEETIKIQEEGRMKRREAEGELLKMEGELKEKLTGLANK